MREINEERPIWPIGQLHRAKFCRERMTWPGGTTEKKASNSQIPCMPLLDHIINDGKGKQAQTRVDLDSYYLT
jgi:hypothetical protein